ncbi:hypothetical protein JYU34_011631 [Plutella xylostella]|uniref:Uncharacterized protein n=1 Tax=Plutella xylostella TaxID=51655 RepID=A0ABQ7QD48_PLUXY|nr:hypothetical protein JYU34_011631 [Plutella xylostella]
MSCRKLPRPVQVRLQRGVTPLSPSATSEPRATAFPLQAQPGIVRGSQRLLGTLLVNVTRRKKPHNAFKINATEDADKKW